MLALSAFSGDASFHAHFCNLSAALHTIALMPSLLDARYLRDKVDLLITGMTCWNSVTMEPPPPPPAPHPKAVSQAEKPPPQTPKPPSQALDLGILSLANALRLMQAA